MKGAAFDASVEALLDGWLAGAGASRAFAAEDGTLMSLADPWEDRAWRSELAERGWLAPGWPASCGGPDWSPAQRVIWYRACGRRFPGYREPTAIAWLGPLLVVADADTTSWMRQILDDCLGWACAVMEPGPGWLAGDFDTTAPLSSDDSVRLTGRKVWVTHFDRASHVAVVTTDGLLIFTADALRGAAGFAAAPLETLDRLTGYWSLTFADCRVEPLVRFTLTPRALRIAGELAGGAGLWGAGACLRGALEVARLLGRLDGAQLNEMEVALAGYEAMEERFAADSFVAMPGFLSPAQRLAHLERRLRPDLEALMTDALGYDALPLVDELRAHNEGPLGSVDAARARKALAELRLTQAWRSGRVDGVTGEAG